ncbi:shikimate kinase [Candidatus Acetothermia bacterium]|nr:shikimate kinase [Candidatus Acetothermia bacterium]MBI3460224.1 shikimate kinase [Candidatus Acetothermia bacterium]
MELDAPRVLPSNIYLVGLMGSGKSTLGHHLAQALKREFIDLDALIERESGQSIREIFFEHGENYFRNLESTCLFEVVKQREKVVALGGGAILRERNRELIRSSGFSIYLKVNPKILAERLGDCSARPLLQGLDANAKLERLRDLLQERQSFYEQADLIVPNEGSSEKALARITSALERLCKLSK